MQGRRLADTVFGELPEGVEPGDYWRYLDRQTGEPLKASDIRSGEDVSGNLTDSVWGFCAPNGCGIGTLVRHTVRENEDGTATIAAGDGSSNSVLIEGAGCSWHGYLDHGVWNAA